MLAHGAGRRRRVGARDGDRRAASRRRRARAAGGASGNRAPTSRSTRPAAQAPGSDASRRVRVKRIDTPVGRLTLVGGHAGLRGVLWPGETPPAGAASEPHSQARARRRAARRVLRGPADGVRPSARPCRHAVSAAGVARPRVDPLRDDAQLRRAGPPARTPTGCACRRRGERAEPGSDRPPVPPPRGLGREAHRLRRRPRRQALAAGARESDPRPQLQWRRP